MRRPRLLFYCQHSVGLGHLVRSMHLADGLAGDFDVTLLNGGPWPADLPQPGSLEIVHLPALGLDADYALVSRDERFTVEEAVRLRQAMILEAYRGTAPDVVLIELWPFGRKKFTPELMPLLEAAHADRPTTMVVCSLRDILVGSRRDFEDMNRLKYFNNADPAGQQGFRDILVTEGSHPFAGAWWPPGHIIGYEHTFVHTVLDLLKAVDEGKPPSPNFEDGVRNQKVLDAHEKSAASGKWERV